MILEKIKAKYEVILGFVTLVISLSAFKDELKEITINLIYITFTLSDYFLYCVYAFSLSLYLYIIELALRDLVTPSKLFNYLLLIAFTLFIFILLSPIVLLIIFGLVNLYALIVDKDLLDESKQFGILLFKLALLFQSATAIRIAIKFKTAIKKAQIEKISDEEIIELEKAIRLYNDSYYSHSILESFKALESHLYKQIVNKNYLVSRNRFDSIVTLALKLNLITHEEFNEIKKLREMRNLSSHQSEVVFTKNDAEFALNFVKLLLSKNMNS